MYSKVDHLIKGRIRVQVKTPHQKSVDETHWAFKTHKSHGHGLLELYKANEFDIVALFIGFKIDELNGAIDVAMKNSKQIRKLL